VKNLLILKCGPFKPPVSRAEARKKDKNGFLPAKKNWKPGKERGAGTKKNAPARNAKKEKDDPSSRTGDNTRPSRN